MEPRRHYAQGFRSVFQFDDDIEKDSEVELQRTEPPAAAEGTIRRVIAKIVCYDFSAPEVNCEVC